MSEAELTPKEGLNKEEQERLFYLKVKFYESQDNIEGLMKKIEDSFEEIFGKSWKDKLLKEVNEKT